MNKILQFFFKKQIDKMVDEKLHTTIIQKYIDEHFFVKANTSSFELGFRGKEFIKFVTACVYEVVKEAENFVEMELYSEGYERMLVTIQKLNKKRPIQIIKELKQEIQLLKEMHNHANNTK